MIAATRSTEREPACLVGTSSSAVALAAVAVAANQYGGAAAGAQIASSGEIHWSPLTNGERRRRPLRDIYSACSVASSQLWARHRVWLGRWSRCRARVSTGRSDIYRIRGADATPMHVVQRIVDRRQLPRSRLIVRCLRLPDDGLRCNPSAGSPAGSKP